MSDMLSALFAGLAVVISVYTLYSHKRSEAAAGRRADVTVYFHWLTSRATVLMPEGGQVQVGYHLVIENRGPATARNVKVSVVNRDGQSLKLLDLQRDELPLDVLDVSARYPIPWAIEPFERHARRFRATLSWEDGAGHHHRDIPLRRGQLPTQ